MRPLRVALARFAIYLALTSWTAPARAYTVETPVTDGCHELITQAALRSARARSLAAAPLAAQTNDDVALLDDQPFTPDADMRDLGAVSLLLGVRDNDLKGLAPTDLAGIAVVQGDPSSQPEHCLRSYGDREPAGTATAVAACRAFIFDRVSTALEFLDEGGAPDASARDALAVPLAFRGSVVASLPGFYVHLGQALHSLQDAVSHSYRTSDARTITEILDWLNVADNDLNEATEGPEHNSSLDRCVSLDAFRAARLQVAKDESTALLLAALGPGTREERLAQVNALLDSALAVQSGCTAANGWCSAPERQYPAQFGGCASLGPGSLACAGLALVFAFALRRRHRAALLCAFVCLASAPAFAEPSESTAALEARFADRPAFGLPAALGGSIDHTAMNVALGARLRVDSRWLVGLDVEWNPWFSISGTHAQPGAFNVYATGVRRWPMISEDLDLRTTAHLGESTILFAVFGVPKWTTGLYLGGSLLGLEWEASRTISIIIDPADVSFPVPQLHGTPFGYLQYRFTVSLQWGS